MNCRDIVEKYLIENGFDGLYNPEGECACENNDLAPCDDIIAFCEPGYKTKCDPENCPNGGGCDFHISKAKEIK